MSSWSLQDIVIEWIAGYLPAGSTILELGSGDGTGRLAGLGFSMISIEHDPKFLGLHPSRYIHAPYDGTWYDIEAIRDGLSNASYDLLIIDGPPAALSVRGRTRMGMLEHLSLFDLRVPIIVDDVNRAAESELATSIIAYLEGCCEQIPLESATARGGPHHALAIIPHRGSRTAAQV